jgi:uncharacterized protein (TIGR02266 family)
MSSVPSGHDAPEEVNMPDLKARDPRIPKSLPVIFLHGDSPVKAYARDISRGGLFVATGNPLGGGEQFTLRLQLPGHEETLTLSCEVAWSREEEGRTGGGMGVRFLEIPREHEALLQPFVSTLERMDIKPFQMSEKDNRILGEYLRNVQENLPSR